MSLLTCLKSYSVFRALKISWFLADCPMQRCLGPNPTAVLREEGSAQRDQHFNKGTKETDTHSLSLNLKAGQCPGLGILRVLPVAVLVVDHLDSAMPRDCDLASLRAQVKPHDRHGARLQREIERGGGRWLHSHWHHRLYISIICAIYTRGLLKASSVVKQLAIIL